MKSHRIWGACFSWPQLLSLHGEAARKLLQSHCWDWKHRPRAYFVASNHYAHLASSVPGRVDKFHPLPFNSFVSWNLRASLSIRTSSRMRTVTDAGKREVAYRGIPSEIPANRITNKAIAANRGENKRAMYRAPLKNFSFWWMLFLEQCWLDFVSIGNLQIDC